MSLERYNVAYMAFFSAIVVAGTIYSLIHQTHAYNVLLSDPEAALTLATSNLASGETSTAGFPTLPVTFLADRRNALNRIFVKFAWFWTTAAFFAQVVTLRSQTPQPDAVETSSINSAVREKSERNGETRQKNISTAPSNDVNLQATVMGAMSISLLRYVVATLLWVFFARWFLGPSLMERVRHYSGAVCTPAHSGLSSSVSKTLLPSTIEPQYCYAGRSLSAKDHPHLFSAFSDADASTSLLRPRWKGGHDISGHTYILVVASLYLLEEITPFIPYLFSPSMHDWVARLIPRPLWAPQDPFSTTHQPQTIARRNLIAMVAVLMLIGFWTMSLAITAVYFHTPQEKVSGLILSLAASLLIPKGG